MNEIKKTIHTVAYLCDTYGVGANPNWLWLMPSDLWFERQKYGINENEDVFDSSKNICLAICWFVVNAEQLTLEEQSGVKLYGDVVLG